MNTNTKPLDFEKLEAFLAEFPIYEYRLLDTQKISVYPRVRTICRVECERYGSTWACPPAVGTIEECEKRIKAYPQGIFFSSVAEVSDLINMEEMLSTRRDHEELTTQVGKFLQQEGYDIFILSTESCDICDECAYPDSPCRFPEQMHPCVESHGIVVTELAERFEMDYTIGYNQILWFGIIFLEDTYIRE